MRLLIDWAMGADPSSPSLLGMVLVFISVYWYLCCLYWSGYGMMADLVEAADLLTRLGDVPEPLLYCFAKQVGEGVVSHAGSWPVSMTCVVIEEAPH